MGKMSETRKGIYLIGLSYVVTLISAFVLIFKLFYPRQLIVAIVVYLSNWVLFFIGTKKVGKKYLKKVKQYKKILVISVLIFVIVYVIYLLIPMGKVEFLGMTKGELREKIDGDYALMKIYINGLDETMRKIDGMNYVFNATSLDDLNESEKEKLLELWADYIDYQVALNKLVDDYRYFYQINYYVNRDLHARAFLIGYASFLASYDNGLRLIDYTFENELFETLLDDSYPEYGIGKGMYSELRRRVIHFDDVTRLTAGYGNYLFLYPEYEKLGLTETDAGVFDYIEKAYKFSTKKLASESVVWFPMSGMSTFRDKTYDVYFPVQKGVANQMGNTRVTTRHDNFITEDQIEEMRAFMEPGDIMLQRRNWYTSNIGIPGFWPHAAIYIGTKDEFVDYFNTLEVNAYVAENGFDSVEEMLKETAPEFYEDYKLNDDDVIEAIAAGVVLQPLKKSARADYVGTVRPKMDKLNKFKAMMNAISYYGRPYDYHFDFVTDSALVCSELVYKSYRPFLDMSLKEHAGRPMYTATNLIVEFDERYDGDSEFEFVYFLEGNEENQNAVVSDLKSFRETATRVKWDIMQD